MFHLGNLGGGRVHAVLAGLVEELGNEPVDAAVQGGGEQQALPAGGRGAQDPGDAGEKAEIGHVVGLVEDGDGDIDQRDVALTYQVLEAARGGHDDVDAAAQLLHLRVLGHAAEDGHGPQPDGGAEGRDRVGDLGGQLTGGGEDQGARPSGERTARDVLPRGDDPGEARDDGECEGEGLAGAGAAPAEHVPAREGVGERGGLDGERGGDAPLGEAVHECQWHSQGSERRRGADGHGVLLSRVCGSPPAEARSSAAGSHPRCGGIRPARKAVQCSVGVPGWAAPCVHTLTVRLSRTDGEEERNVTHGLPAALPCT